MQISSPCIGVCTLDPRNLCSGCLRTREEIARWTSMTESERRFIMERMLPDRGQSLRPQTQGT